MAPVVIAGATWHQAEAVCIQHGAHCGLHPLQDQTCRLMRCVTCWRRWWRRLCSTWSCLQWHLAGLPVPRTVDGQAPRAYRRWGRPSEAYEAIIQEALIRLQLR